ncbi:MAG TPA: serine/threonine-protein kinase [Candidatus Saccharimonadia bacterium]|nr:serine/threonine-protein kinase [Candidatus Saccharimonadia bacterium]
MSVEPGGAFEAPGYEVRERIGGSEGADVYLAEQRALGRRVALKVLRGESADPEQLARFEFETRTAAALLHPNIVPVLDSGTTPDGRSYYAMPYLEAGDLTRRIPLAPDEVRRVGIALCDALWYAHGRNVVHRDIKPSNVLFDDGGRPMLADFGIATTIIGTRGLTVPGRTLGAARYISPEQARGEKVDPRADLYSLGVVIFEMLTGRVPYDASDDVALARQHAEAAVPRLPPPLAAWQSFFERALAKSPADRFMSARTMAQGLEAIGTAPAAIPAIIVAPPERGATAAAAAAAAAAASDVRTAGLAGDDDLPRLHAEAPSYVRTSAPAPRAWRTAPILALLGVVAIAALIGYLLTRDADESFEPLVAEPSRAGHASAPAVAAQPPPVAPGSVTSAASAPAKAANAAAAAASVPVPAVDTPPDEDTEAPDLSGIEGEAPSDDEIADILGPDDPLPDRSARGREASDRTAPRNDADAAFADEDLAGVDGIDDLPDRVARRDDDGEFGGDYADDPAFAPGSWTPPLPQPALDGPPDAQLAELDALTEDARAWLEDERQRVEALQDTASPYAADRARESFEADEQAFERWLDRVDALRARIERDTR